MAFPLIDVDVLAHNILGKGTNIVLDGLKNVESYMESARSHEAVSHAKVEEFAPLPTIELFAYAGAPANASILAPYLSSLGLSLMKSDDLNDILSGFLTIVGILGINLLDPAVKFLPEKGYTVTIIEIEDVSQILNVVTFSDLDVLKQAEKVFNAGVTSDADPEHVCATTKASMSEGFLSTEVSPNCIPVIVGITICFMSKNITTNNRDAWITSRIKAFSGAVSATRGPREVKSGHFPSVIACEDIHNTFMDSSFRKFIFEHVLHHAKRADRWGGMCRVVMLMNRGAELTHVHLIMQYICEMNPILLTHRALASELKTFFKAMKVLSTIDKGKRPFVKLLFDGKTTELFNRNHYKLLSRLAKEIGQDFEPTLKNYRGGGEAVDAGTEELIQELRQYGEDHRRKAKVGSEDEARLEKGKSIAKALQHFGTEMAVDNNVDEINPNVRRLRRKRD